MGSVTSKKRFEAGFYDLTDMPAPFFLRKKETWTIYN